MMAMEWKKSEQEQVQQQAMVKMTEENTAPSETSGERETASACIAHMNGVVGSRASASGYGAKASRRIETKAAVAVRDLVMRFERRRRSGEEQPATEHGPVGRLAPSRLDAFTVQRKSSEGVTARARTAVVKDARKEEEAGRGDGSSVDTALCPIESAETTAQVSGVLLHLLQEEATASLHLDFEMLSMCSSQEVETVTATTSECGTDADIDFQVDHTFTGDMDARFDVESDSDQYLAYETSDEESELEDRYEADDCHQLTDESGDLLRQRERHRERKRPGGEERVQAQGRLPGQQHERGGEGGKGRAVRPGHRPTRNKVGQGFPYQREVAPKYMEYAADKSSSYWRRLEIALVRRGVVGGESG